MPAERAQLLVLAEWVARWSASRPDPAHEPRIADLMADMHAHADEIMCDLARDALRALAAQHPEEGSSDAG